LLEDNANMFNLLEVEKLVFGLEFNQLGLEADKDVKLDERVGSCDSEVCEPNILNPKSVGKL